MSDFRLFFTGHSHLLPDLSNEFSLNFENPEIKLSHKKYYNYYNKLLFRLHVGVHYISSRYLAMVTWTDLRVNMVVMHRGWCPLHNEHR